METKQIVVTERSNEAGAVVWWALSGEVNTQQLRNELSARGADYLPVFDTTPRTALKRAINGISERMLFPRALPGKTGWALVRERAMESDLQHEVEMRVWLDDKSETGCQNLRIDPFNHPLAEHLRQLYEHHLGTLDVEGLSTWLTGVVIPQLSSVALRDRGGFYFMPQPSVDMMRRVADACEVLSGCRFFEIPAMRTEQAVQAIMAALQRDINLACTDLEGSITPELTERGVKTRTKRCFALLDYVQTYEQTLGVGLQSMRDQIERIKAAITVATIAANMDALALNKVAV